MPGRQRAGAASLPAVGHRRGQAPAGRLRTGLLAAAAPAPVAGPRPAGAPPALLVPARRLVRFRYIAQGTVRRAGHIARTVRGTAARLHLPAARSRPPI